MPVIAKVAVEKTAYHFDKLFSYLVPEQLTDKITRGVRVLIPFGAGNQDREGMVFDFSEEAAEESYKPIHRVLDEQPLLPPDFIPIISFLKQRTFCTYYEAIRAMLPAGFHYDAASVYRRISGTKAAEELTEEESAVFRLLKTPKPFDAIAAAFPQKSTALLRRLLTDMADRGILTVETRVKRRVGDETLRMVRLLPEFSETGTRLTGRQKQMLSILREVETASVKELCYLSGSTETVLKNLVRLGAAEYFEREVYRSPKGDSKKAAAPGLRGTAFALPHGYAPGGFAAWGDRQRQNRGVFEADRAGAGRRQAGADAGAGDRPDPADGGAVSQSFWRADRAFAQCAAAGGANGRVEAGPTRRGFDRDRHTFGGLCAGAGTGTADCGRGAGTLL